MSRRDRQLGCVCGHCDCGDDAAVGGAIHRHAPQLYRHLCPGRARYRAVDRRRRLDVVRPGRVRRHRRLRHRLADDRPRRFALARAFVRACDDGSRSGAPRRGYAAARRTLPAARHHRLGSVDLLFVRQHRRARRTQRHDRRAADLDRLALAGAERSDLLFDLGHARIGDVGDRQFAAIARGPRDPQPARRRRDGRKPRHQCLSRSVDHIRRRRTVGGDVGLALRPHEPLRQPGALRCPHGHRLFVHGDPRRLRADLRRGGGIGAGDATRQCAARPAAAALE